MLIEKWYKQEALVDDMMANWYLSKQADVSEQVGNNLSSLSLLDVNLIVRKV